jgi:hypothetical protein
VLIRLYVWPLFRTRYTLIEVATYNTLKQGSGMALPPFMNSTGLIGKIFEKIQQAKVPPRYTQDFQATVLGFGSGSARPFIPFLKRLGFLQSDGYANRNLHAFSQFRQ